MEKRFRLVSFAAGATALLLIAVAVLTACSILIGALDIKLFGSRAEKVLLPLMMSCITFAWCSFSLTVVFGIKDICESVRSIVPAFKTENENTGSNCTF